MKLSQYLVKNGISQKELSDLLKVSQPTIHKWLYGKSLPSASLETPSCGPLSVLLKHLDLDNTEEDFKSFKEVLRGFWKSKKYQNKEAADWSSWEDIPTAEIRSLIKICKAE